MKLFKSLSSLFSDRIIGEIIRFAIVGFVATLIHYLIYYILQHWISYSIAYTIGYLISFFCNFWLTSSFTFRSRRTVKKGLGFGGAHLFNYLFQLGLLNLFVLLGMSKVWAPIPTYAISIPVNFILVRYVFIKR